MFNSWVFVFCSVRLLRSVWLIGKCENKEECGIYHFGFFFIFLWLLEFGVLKVVMISWWGIGLVRKCRESK
jgi:hypothetical protein